VYPGEIDDAFIVMPDMFLAPLEELGYDEHTVVVKSEKKEEEDETSFVKTLERAEEKAEKENASEPAENEGIPEEKEDTLEDKTEEKEDIISSETVTSYIERESLALYALKKAAERKVDMIFQYTTFTSQYPLETLDNIKVLVISDEMLYKLTGFFPNNTEKALRSLMALSQRVKAKYYVVQQGNHGAFIYDGSHYEIVSAPSTLVPRNPKENEKRMQQTFMGALAAEYLESKNIVRASKFAVIVSLLTRAKFGNLEKVLSRAEIEQYAQEHGFDLFR
jgi:sugar/nucleoside kinase (ribokinase family)